MQAFSDLSPTDCEIFDIIGPDFTRVHVNPNIHLYHNGDIANSLYIIEEGELALTLSADRGSKIVETLLPGTMVGALEMFGNRHRSCSLVALSEAVLWRLDLETYKRLCVVHPKLMLNFISKIAIPFETIRYYNTVHHWPRHG